MGNLKHAEKFWDLIVYQKARALAAQIYHLSKSFPKEETYSLTDQIRRASRSVGAQIAEGWGKRRYEKSFISKLVDADGEQHEVQHWLLIASDCDYIDQNVSRQLIKDCKEIGRLLQGMITKSSQFSNPKMIKEPQAEYILNIEEEYFNQTLDNPFIPNN